MTSAMATPSTRTIRIFDSTLRDGEQAPGNAMSPDQKLEIALGLEDLGVDTIEAGFPSSSTSDYKATQLISAALTTAKFATLNRATKSDIDIAADAGGVERQQLQLMATGSDVHLEHKRGISRAEGIREIVESIRYARSLGFTDITLGLEDASRGSDEMLRPVVEASLAEGVHTVALADTTGCMVPSEYFGLVARVRSWIPDDVILSTHCHHDLGLSLANALAGIQAGADEVQVTLAGIGERAGNTPLEELIAVLTFKGEHYGALTNVRTEGMYALFLRMAGFIGLEAPRNKALFGTNAFATQAGIHQAGMLRDPITYEYIEPRSFGRERSIQVGRHSGRHALRHVLDQLGIEPDAQAVDALYEEFIAGRAGGECMELDDLRDLLAARLGAQAGTQVGVEAGVGQGA